MLMVCVGFAQERATELHTRLAWKGKKRRRPDKTSFQALASPRWCRGKEEIVAVRGRVMSRLLRGGTLGVAVAAQAAMASICNIAGGGNSSADWGGGVYRSDKLPSCC